MARHACEVQEFDQAYFIKSLHKTGFINDIIHPMSDDVFNSMINFHSRTEMYMSERSLSYYAFEVVNKRGKLSFVVQSADKKIWIMCVLTHDRQIATTSLRSTGSTLTCSASVKCLIFVASISRCTPQHCRKRKSKSSCRRTSVPFVSMVQTD